MQSWQAGWLDAAMKLVSLPGSVPVAVLLMLLAALALYFRGLRTEAGLFLAAIVTSYALRTAIKMSIARPRPTEDMVRVLDQADGYSFPSGHVMHYVVYLGILAAVLWDEMKPGAGRWLLMAVVAALLAAIGLSRIYLGAHWPSDVLGGYAFGGFVLLGALWALRRLRRTS